MLVERTVYVLDDGEAVLSFARAFIRGFSRFRIGYLRASRRFLSSRRRGSNGDAVLLDVRLPGWGYGLEVQAQLARMRSDLPVIFCATPR